MNYILNLEEKQPWATINFRRGQVIGYVLAITRPINTCVYVDIFRLRCIHNLKSICPDGLDAKNPELQRFSPYGCFDKAAETDAQTAVCPGRE